MTIVMCNERCIKCSELKNEIGNQIIKVEVFEIKRTVDTIPAEDCISITIFYKNLQFDKILT